MRSLLVLGALGVAAALVPAAARAACDSGWTAIDADTCYREAPLCPMVQTELGPISACLLNGTGHKESTVHVARVNVQGSTGRTLRAPALVERMLATTDFARLYDCSVAINGSFFSSNGNSHSRVVGTGTLSASGRPQGEAWGAAGKMEFTCDDKSATSYVDGYLMVDAASKAVRTYSTCPEEPKPGFTTSSERNFMTSDVLMAVPGPHLLVHAGQRRVWPDTCVSTTKNKDFNRAEEGECGVTSRTAIGTDRARTKVYFLTVDGEGATISDVADVMMQLQADWAVNLDGGGSTAMSLRRTEAGETHHDLVVAPRDNYPDLSSSTGAPVQRPIAFNVGFCRGPAAAPSFFSEPYVWWRRYPKTPGLVRTFTHEGGWFVDRTVRTLGDVDGDGLADVVAFGNNDVFVISDNGANQGVTILQGTRTSFGEDTKRNEEVQPARYSVWTDQFGYNDQWKPQDSQRFVVDVNGSDTIGGKTAHRADILALGRQGAFVALSNGTAFGPAIPATGLGFMASLASDPATCTVVAADVNGDGKADVVGFGAETWLSLGQQCSASSCTFAAPVSVHASFGTNKGWTAQKHERRLADVNHDGKLDIVGFGNDEVLVATWRCESNVCKFGPASSWYDTGFTYNVGNWRTEIHDRFVADVDGDHNADIVGIGNSNVYVALSDGVGHFAPRQVWDSTGRWTLSDTLEAGSDNPTGKWDKTKHVRLLADVSGDGKADLVGFGQQRIIVSRAP
jgi:hypothetical protein